MDSFLIYPFPFQRVEVFSLARVFQSAQVSWMKQWVIFPLALLQLLNPFVHCGFADVHCRSSGGNGVMLIEYELGSFEAKLGAKIASVTSGHNVTCF
jgi:hypothetical protein